MDKGRDGGCRRVDICILCITILDLESESGGESKEETLCSLFNTRRLCFCNCMDGGGGAAQGDPSQQLREQHGPLFLTQYCQ